MATAALQPQCRRTASLTVTEQCTRAREAHAQAIQMTSAQNITMQQAQGYNTALVRCSQESTSSRSSAQMARVLLLIVVG